ncbi:Asx homology domain-containing protein [Xylariaceae sp. FL0594]|nr:Asx homology domain-containing protein [Xylariaceae sp. FL0594]
MPPSKRSSKPASSQTGVATPRRTTRSRLVHGRNRSLEGPNSSSDELVAQGPVDVRGNTQAEAARPQVADGTLNESTAGCKRSRSRTASVSNGESFATNRTPTPCSSGTPIKKQDEEDELAAEEPAQKKPKRTGVKAIRLATSRKGRSKWDDPEQMLANPNSPLVKTNLRDILCNPRAWDILTPGEKKEVLSKFPDRGEILDADTPGAARPDIAALRNNDNFRHDVRQYQEGLSQGYHDPEWILQAQAAHMARGAGLYDALLADEFEEKWDTPMPKFLVEQQHTQEQEQKTTEDGYVLEQVPTSGVNGADDVHLLADTPTEATAQPLPGQPTADGMHTLDVTRAEIPALSGDVNAAKHGPAPVLPSPLGQVVTNGTGQLSSPLTEAKTITPPQITPESDADATKDADATTISHGKPLSMNGTRSGPSPSPASSPHHHMDEN